MFRNLLLASGVTLGLVGMNLTATEARADGFGFAISGKNFGIGFSNFAPVYAPPVYAAPVYAPPVYYPPVVQHYDVYYRDCYRSPWRLYGTYHSHHHAHRAVNGLEYRGYDARVRHH